MGKGKDDVKGQWKMTMEVKRQQICCLLLGKRNRAQKKKEKEWEKGKAQGKIAKEVITRFFCWAPGFPKRSKKKTSTGGLGRNAKKMLTQ